MTATSELATIETLAEDAANLPALVGKVNELVTHANAVVSVVDEVRLSVEKLATAGESLTEDVVEDFKASVAKLHSFFHPNAVVSQPVG